MLHIMKPTKCCLKEGVERGKWDYNGGGEKKY
jgi:hypothetical protein